MVHDHEPESGAAFPAILCFSVNVRVPKAAILSLLLTNSSVGGKYRDVIPTRAVIAYFDGNTPLRLLSAITLCEEHQARCRCVVSILSTSRLKGI